MYRVLRHISIVMVLCLLLTGCNGNQGSSSSKVISSTDVSQGKAIEGISDVVWAFHPKKGELLTQHLATEDSIYVGSNQYMNAIDTSTGNQKWERSIVGNSSVPVLVGNTLLYHDDEGIHAVDAMGGEDKWVYKYNPEVSRSKRESLTVASLSNAFIFEKSSDGYLLKALNIKTGDVNWEYSKVNTPLFVYSKDKVYVPVDGVIHIIDEKSGAEEGSILTEAWIVDLYMDKNQLFIVDISGQVSLYDLKSKEFKWQYTNVAFEGPDVPSLIIDDDIVLAFNEKWGAMARIDRQSGKEQWYSKKGYEANNLMYGFTITRPIVSESSIYVCILEGESNEVKGFPGYTSLIVLDNATGQEQSRYKVNDLILYSPSLVGDLVIATTQDSVTAFRNQGRSDDEKKQDTQTEEIKKVKKDELQIHGIKIGDSSDDVVKALGMPDDKEVNNKSGYVIYTYKGVELLFIDNKVAAIQSFDDEYRTKQGIGRGDTMDDVVRSYQGYGSKIYEKLALIEGDDVLISFNLSRFFDDDPYYVSTISIFDAAQLQREQSIVSYYLADIIGESAFTSLMEIGFAELESSNTESASIQQHGTSPDPVPEELEPNIETEFTDVKRYEGKWSSPASDELAFELEFFNDEKGQITYYLEGEYYPYPFSYFAEPFYIILYEGENEDTVVKIHLKEDGNIIYEANDRMTDMERVGND